MTLLSRYRQCTLHPKLPSWREARRSIIQSRRLLSRSKFECSPVLALTVINASMIFFSLIRINYAHVQIFNTGSRNDNQTGRYGGQKTNSTTISSACNFRAQRCKWKAAKRNECVKYGKFPEHEFIVLSRSNILRHVWIQSVRLYRWRAATGNSITLSCMGLLFLGKEK